MKTSFMAMSIISFSVLFVYDCRASGRRPNIDYAALAQIHLKEVPPSLGLGSDMSGKELRLWGKTKQREVDRIKQNLQAELLTKNASDSLFVINHMNNAAVRK